MGSGFRCRRPRSYVDPPRTAAITLAHLKKKKSKADKNQAKAHVSAYKAAQDQVKPSFNPFAKKT